ncbi:hypothetical protein ACO0RG_002599 [Hanseniaspora osmophila]
MSNSIQPIMPLNSKVIKLLHRRSSGGSSTRERDINRSSVGEQPYSNASNIKNYTGSRKNSTQSNGMQGHASLDDFREMVNKTSAAQAWKKGNTTGVITGGATTNTVSANSQIPVTTSNTNNSYNVYTSAFSTENNFQNESFIRSTVSNVKYLDPNGIYEENDWGMGKNKESKENEELKQEEEDNTDEEDWAALGANKLRQRTVLNLNTTEKMDTKNNNASNIEINETPVDKDAAYLLMNLRKK